MNPVPEEVVWKRRIEAAQRVLQGVPTDHEWSKALNTLLDAAEREELAALLLPPSASSVEDRTYNAGRGAMLHDLRARLRKWLKVSVALESSVSERAGTEI